MSKQVRLRRGTTAQHGAFTGAEGEVTVDTTKKVLVLHDGVTPGGKPIEGWVKLDPSNALLLQEIKSRLRITGGNDDLPGLDVTGFAALTSLLVSGDAELNRLVISQEELTYAPTVNLNFRNYGAKRLTLAGNVTFTSSNVGIGREVLVKIASDGSTRNLAFPSGWRFVGGSAPASLAASKSALLRLISFGTTDNDIIAIYNVEP